MQEVYEKKGSSKLSKKLLSSNVCSDKQEFKGHLTGLYNGLANIMKTTCQIEATPKDTAPFVVEKAVHNIMFIKHHMKRQDEFDAVSQEGELEELFLLHIYSFFCRRIKIGGLWPWCSIASFSGRLASALLLGAFSFCQTRHTYTKKYNQ